MADQPQAATIDRRYALQKTLGLGGMGVVYRALDLLTGKTVALKQVTVPVSQLLPAPAGEHSNLYLALAQEFQTLATIRHPNVISVYDFGFDEQRLPYFTMEYLEDGRSIIDAGGKLADKDKVNPILQMLQALVYLHRRGVLHRDLKPANALVLDGRLKVLDFGLSVITSQTVEHLTQTTPGTMAYMAPELFQGAAYSRRSDLYAVGLIAYELFTGTFPYSDSNMATLLNDILSKRIDASSSAMTGAISTVVNRLLAKKPEERFSTATEVMQALCAAANLPLPPETRAIRESFLQSARFVGRDRELAHLGDALAAAKRGQGRALLIGGEGGVGKSRLLQEFRIRALIQGMLVLQGQAVSDGRSPYQMWRSVLRALAVHSELDVQEVALFKTLVPDLDQLLRRTVPDAPELAPSELHERLLQTIIGAQGTLDQPLLIILEDLQWAGRESVTLLGDLAAALPDRPLLLVSTFRDDMPLPLIDELSAGQSYRLDRLTAENIAELSKSILGRAGRDDEVVGLLQRETEGNALFLVEAIRTLADEAGRLEGISGETLPVGISAGGIQAILRRRLEHVPAWAAPLLQLAAVGGRQLDTKLLSALEPGVDLDSWLATCAHVPVIEAQGESWRFTHDKLRTAVLDDLPDERFRELHQRVAYTLEGLYPDSPEHAPAMAHHWAMAGSVEMELLYSEKAGIQAAKNNANADAIRFLERSLELLLTRTATPERNRRELNLLMSLGPPLMAVRGFGASEVENAYARARDLAVRTGQIDLVFRTTWGQWEYYSHGTLADLETAERLLTQLFELAAQSGDPGHLLEAHHAGWGTAFALGDAAEMFRHGRQGLDIYDRHRFADHRQDYGHDPGVCALANGGLSLWLLGYPDQARQRALAGYALAESLGHPLSFALGQWGIIVVAMLRGEYQVGLEKAEELLVFAQRHDMRLFVIFAEYIRTISLLRQGKGWDPSVQMPNSLRRSTEIRGTNLRAWYVAEYLEACLANNAVDAGLEAAEEDLANSKDIVRRIFGSEVRRMHGDLLLAKGEERAPEAEAQLRSALELSLRQSARSLELRAVMSLARLWRQQGNHDRALAVLAEAYGRFSEGFDTVDLIAAKGLLDELQ